MAELRQPSGQDNSFLEIEKLGLPQHIASVAIDDQSTAPGGIVRFEQILATSSRRCTCLRSSGPSCIRRPSIPC